MEQHIFKKFKTKKNLIENILICISCGSDDVVRSKYTLHCQKCGYLNFYEVI